MAVKVRLDMARLMQIKTQYPNAVKNLIKTTAFGTEGRAKAFAPVRTGALRASIHVEEASEFTSIVADGVHYGIYQEYGTYKMAAHSFMRPAIEAMRESWQGGWRRLFERL